LVPHGLIHGPELAGGSGTLTCCSEDMKLVTEEEAKKLIAE
jgi:hypothetical protein